MHVISLSRHAADQTESYFTQSIQEIVRAMSVDDRVLVLCNTTAVNASFYDTYNQHFVVRSDGTCSTSVSIGSSTGVQPISSSLELILIVSKNATLPPALLNRFEKFRISMSDGLQFRLLKQPALSSVVSGARQNLLEFVHFVSGAGLFCADVHETVASLLLSALPLWEADGSAALGCPQWFAGNSDTLQCSPLVLRLLQIVLPETFLRYSQKFNHDWLGFYIDHLSPFELFKCVELCFSSSSRAVVHTRLHPTMWSSPQCGADPTFSPTPAFVDLRATSSREQMALELGQCFSQAAILFYVPTEELLHEVQHLIDENVVYQGRVVVVVFEPVKQAVAFVGWDHYYTDGSFSQNPANEEFSVIQYVRDVLLEEGEADMEAVVDLACLKAFDELKQRNYPLQQQDARALTAAMRTCTPIWNQLQKQIAAAVNPEWHMQLLASAASTAGSATCTSLAAEILHQLLQPIFPIVSRAMNIFAQEELGAADFSLVERLVALQATEMSPRAVRTVPVFPLWDRLCAALDVVLNQTKDPLLVAMPQDIAAILDAIDSNPTTQSQFALETSRRQFEDIQPAGLQSACALTLLRCCREMYSSVEKIGARNYWWTLWRSEKFYQAYVKPLSQFVRCCPSCNAAQLQTLQPEDLSVQLTQLHNVHLVRELSKPQDSYAAAQRWWANNESVSEPRQHLFHAICTAGFARPGFEPSKWQAVLKEPDITTAFPMAMALAKESGRQSTYLTSVLSALGRQARTSSSQELFRTVLSSETLLYSLPAGAIEALLRRLLEGLSAAEITQTCGVFLEPLLAKENAVVAEEYRLPFFSPQPAAPLTWALCVVLFRMFRSASTPSLAAVLLSPQPNPNLRTYQSVERAALRWAYLHRTAYEFGEAEKRSQLRPSVEFHELVSGPFPGDYVRLFYACLKSECGTGATFHHLLQQTCDLRENLFGKNAVGLFQITNPAMPTNLPWQDDPADPLYTFYRATKEAFEKGLEANNMSAFVAHVNSTVLLHKDNVWHLRMFLVTLGFNSFLSKGRTAPPNLLQEIVSGSGAQLQLTAVEQRLLELCFSTQLVVGLAMQDYPQYEVEIRRFSSYDILQSLLPADRRPAPWVHILFVAVAFAMGTPKPNYFYSFLCEWGSVTNVILGTTGSGNIDCNTKTDDWVKFEHPPSGVSVGMAYLHMVVIFGLLALQALLFPQNISHAHFSGSIFVADAGWNSGESNPRAPRAFRKALSVRSSAPFYKLADQQQLTTDECCRLIVSWLVTVRRDALSQVPPHQVTRFLQPALQRADLVSVGAYADLRFESAISTCTSTPSFISGEQREILCIEKKLRPFRAALGWPAVVEMFTREEQTQNSELGLLSLLLCSTDAGTNEVLNSEDTLHQLQCIGDVLPAIVNLGRDLHALLDKKVSPDSKTSPLSAMLPSPLQSLPSYLVAQEQWHRFQLRASIVGNCKPIPVPKETDALSSVVHVEGELAFGTVHNAACFLAAMQNSILLTVDHIWPHLQRKTVDLYNVTSAHCLILPSDDDLLQIVQNFVTSTGDGWSVDWHGFQAALAHQSKSLLSAPRIVLSPATVKFAPPASSWHAFVCPQDFLTPLDRNLQAEISRICNLLSLPAVRKVAQELELWISQHPVAHMTFSEPLDCAVLDLAPTHQLSVCLLDEAKQPRFRVNQMVTLCGVLALASGTRPSIPHVAALSQPIDPSAERAFFEELHSKSSEVNRMLVLLQSQVVAYIASSPVSELTLPLLDLLLWNLNCPELQQFHQCLASQSIGSLRLHHLGSLVRHLAVAAREHCTVQGVNQPLNTDEREALLQRLHDYKNMNVATFPEASRDLNNTLAHLTSTPAHHVRPTMPLLEEIQNSGYFGAEMLPREIRVEQVGTVAAFIQSFRLVEVHASLPAQAIQANGAWARVSHTEPLTRFSLENLAGKRLFWLVPKRDAPLLNFAHLLGVTVSALQRVRSVLYLYENGTLLVKDDEHNAILCVKDGSLVPYDLTVDTALRCERGEIERDYYLVSREVGEQEEIEDELFRFLLRFNLIQFYPELKGRIDLATLLQGSLDNLPLPLVAVTYLLSTGTEAQVRLQPNFMDQIKAAGLTGIDFAKSTNLKELRSRFGREDPALQKLKGHFVTVFDDAPQIPFEPQLLSNFPFFEDIPPLHPLFCEIQQQPWEELVKTMAATAPVQKFARFTTAHDVGRRLVKYWANPNNSAETIDFVAKESEIDGLSLLDFGVTSAVLKHADQQALWRGTNTLQEIVNDHSSDYATVQERVADSCMIVFFSNALAVHPITRHASIWRTFLVDALLGDDLEILAHYMPVVVGMSQYISSHPVSGCKVFTAFPALVRPFVKGEVLHCKCPIPASPDEGVVKQAIGTNINNFILCTLRVPAGARVCCSVSPVSWWEATMSMLIAPFTKWTVVQYEAEPSPHITLELDSLNL
eukprot:TRINITY_DN9336_c0_g1_i2.p1 TRINITY_DN9336_c0_g1~~TRINITY_DN9336_c0_g1_i2.p1  ORF type:complete len:2425 (-),score=313.65 TRINITY_DN9336_c0_g1_i2:11-7285(-)